MKPQLRNIFKIKEIIQWMISSRVWKFENEVKHDIALDKLSVKEYEDPFRDSGK